MRRNGTVVAVDPTIHYYFGGKAKCVAVVLMWPETANIWRYFNRKGAEKEIDLVRVIRI